MTEAIGKPIRRVEDARLLTGKGRYTSDIDLDGQAHGYVLRSTHPHAILRGIDTAAAKAAPGVLAVLTAEDYAKDGYGEIPHGANPTDLLDPTVPSLANKNGDPVYESRFPVLADDKVRHVGQPVAFVVAETAAQARDAAERVEVDYEPLPAVVDAREAVKPGAPQLFDDAPGNVVLDMERGDKEGVEAAFAKADHVVEMEFISQRVAQAPMEPRVGVADYDPDSGRLTLYADSQGVFVFKMWLAKVFGMDPEKIHTLSHDVGGGFGARNFPYAEHMLLAWTAMRLKRPVKWQGERWESFASEMQGRDFTSKVKLGLDKDGKFLALHVDHLANVGGYTWSYVPLSNGMRLITGCYKFDAAVLTARAVVTNTVPTGPYRGAGRPEAMFNIERIIDIAARKTGLDRLELRRKNMITADDLPFTTALGLPLDSIDLPANMEKTLQMADWDGFPARKTESKARGKLRGIGFASYFETPTGAPMEWTKVVVDPKGEITADIGTGPSGQGHETVFAQVLAEKLGVAFDDVHVSTGDSDRIKFGGGSHSVRSMRLGGMVLTLASENIIDKGTRIAAHVLEAAEADVEFGEGQFRVKGTDKTISLFEVAQASLDGNAPDDLTGGLDGIGEFNGRLRAYPAGAVVAEVEIDPDTGGVEILRYTQVDDIGRVINPLLAEGQVHGGIAQGVGQALMEGQIFDPKTGQIVAGTFMDYAMPRADDFPRYDTAFSEILASSNPLGVKGAGESGTTPAPAVTINAVADALSEYGVLHVETPATPLRIWQAIHG